MCGMDLQVGWGLEHQYGADEYRFGIHSPICWAGVKSTGASHFLFKASLWVWVISERYRSNRENQHHHHLCTPFCQLHCPHHFGQLAKSHNKNYRRSPGCTLRQKKPGWTLFEHQSVSISIHQHQTVPININQHQTASISISHLQSASISVSLSINQHRSVSISINQHLDQPYKKCNFSIFLFL